MTPNVVGAKQQQQQYHEQGGGGTGQGAGGITVFACARLTRAVLSGVLSFLISSKGNSNRGGVRSVRAVPGRVGCVGCVCVWGAKMIAKLNFQFYFSNEKFKSNSRSPLSLSPSSRPLRAADKNIYCI